VKKLLERALSNAFMLRVSKGNRYIFCYHDVSEATAPHHSWRYSTTPERFKEHIDLFQRLFTIVPLEAIANDRDLPSGKNYAALTFDDGFHSVLTHALPVLKASRLPFTVFLNGSAVLTGRNWVTDLVLAADDPVFIGQLLAAAAVRPADGAEPIGAIMANGHFTAAFERRPAGAPHTKIFLDSADVQRLHREGVSMGDHGHSHFVLSRCDDATLMSEVSAGRDLIAGITGALPLHFALPFGKREHYDDRVLDAIRRSGHTHVYSTNPNRLRHRQVGSTDVIPRIGFTGEPIGTVLFYINRALLRTYTI
jgi:peptidoglycan/xylan/chitin deacetylase (PgdA/CDA1 family)